MKHTSKSSSYADAWARLLARSPAELEEQRRAASPAMTGTKQKPCKGPKSAPQSTQATGVLPYPKGSSEYD